jgi:hypothetical protein
VQPEVAALVTDYTRGRLLAAVLVLVSVALWALLFAVAVLTSRGRAFASLRDALGSGWRS